MKTLISTSAKALSLTLVISALTAAYSFAGSNGHTHTEDEIVSNTYSASLEDLEIALANSEAINASFETSPQVKIYDTHFNLIKSSEAPSECNGEDIELLKLIRNSNVLMKFGNVTYYLMSE